MRQIEARYMMREDCIDTCSITYQDEGMQHLDTKLVNFLRPVQFRGKHRLWGKTTFNSGITEALIFGALLELDLSNYVDRTIYLGCYEPLNTYRFKTILKPGMTVIDAGANIGYFSLLAASRVTKTGCVLAYEPHPVNFNILNQAIKRNDLTQVMPFQFGLDETAGSGFISMADKNVFPNRTASMIPEARKLSVKVETKTLDECIGELKLHQVDLLKVDVDGFETRIIKGARKSIEKGLIKNIVIELNEHWLKESGSSATEIYSLLNQYNDVSNETPIATILLGATEDKHFRVKSRWATNHGY